MDELVEATASRGWRNVIPFDRFRKPFQLILASVLVGWMFYNWGTVGVLVIRDYVNLPIWDYWRIAHNYESYRAHDFRVLWEQHNEHRILFPEVIYAIDLLYLRGQQILPLTLSFLFYFGNWIVLAWAFTTTRQGDRFARFICVIAAGIVVASPASSQLLNTPFLLQWTLVQLASLLAFFFVSKLADTSSRIYLVATIICTVVANYSSGNGLLLWPIILLAALVAGVKRRYLLELGVAAVLSLSLYFVGYHFSKETNVMSILHHPLYALGFLSSYLSMPFGFSLPAAGFLNFCLFLVLVFIVWWHRLWTARPVLVYLGFYVFTLATVFITAAGRMNPDDPTYTAATAERYVTVPLVTWAVLLLASAWISTRLRWVLFSWGKIITAALLLYLLSAKLVHLWVAGDELVIMQQQASGLSMESGLAAPELVRNIYPDPRFVAAYLPALKRDHLAMFSEPEATWVGTDAAHTFRIAPSKLGRGAISRVLPVTAGFEVFGWVESARQFRHLVLVNERNQVVGLGERPLAGVLPVFRPPGKRARLAWVGFINGAIVSKDFRAFLVNDAGSTPEISEIGDTFQGPSVTLQDTARPGSALSPIQWLQHQGWIENTIPPKVDTGSFVLGSFLSSWNGSDASTGFAISAPYLVTKHCFVLPVLHGPTIDHQFIRLFDLAGKLITAIPLDPSITTWQLFRINTPKDQVNIVAEDSGNGFGEWAALGQPRSCQ